MPDRVTGEAENQSGSYSSGPGQRQEVAVEVEIRGQDGGGFGSRVKGLMYRLVG